MNRLALQDELWPAEVAAIREWMRDVARRPFDEWPQQPQLKLFLQLAVRRWTAVAYARSESKKLAAAAQHFSIPEETLRSWWKRSGRWSRKRKRTGAD